MSISGLLVTHCTSIESYRHRRRCAGGAAPSSSFRRELPSRPAAAGPARWGRSAHTCAPDDPPGPAEDHVDGGLGRARRALPSLCGTVRFLSNMAGPNFRVARGNSKRKRENINETTNSCSQAASPSVSYSNKRTLKLRL